MHNAWVFYKSAESQITKLEFRREIVNNYLVMHKNLTKGT